MRDYVVEDGTGHIPWSSVIGVEHLNPNSTYRNYLNEINSTLGPECTLSLSLDYESMKLLLKQAQEYNVPFIESNKLKAVFIIKNRNKTVAKRLLIEEGYTDAENLISIIDPYVYKKIETLLDEEMDISHLKKIRKKYLESLLNNPALYVNLCLDREKYMLDSNYYFDSRSKEIDMFESAKLYILDLVSEYLFEDFYINVKIDMEQIIKYVELTGIDLIPQERLDFYKQFSTLDLENESSIVEFFKTNKDIKLIEDFYDDITNLKNASHKSLVDACTKFTKDSKFYNEELSSKYGCEIYYLDGEEFFGFVRSNVDVEKQKLKFANGEVTLVEQPQPTKEKIARMGTSFTYIGKEDIQTFKNPQIYLTMLYKGIDYRKIGHVYHNDSWSSSDYRNYSDYQNELHTPNSLLSESTKYPEIFITDLTGIEPFALVCLDEVTNWDIEFSKRNNMPIVVINSLKYERKYSKENYFEGRYKR